MGLSSSDMDCSPTSNLEPVRRAGFAGSDFKEAVAANYEAELSGLKV
jgi:hypothetical protein